MDGKPLETGPAAHELAPENIDDIRAAMAEAGPLGPHDRKRSDLLREALGKMKQAGTDSSAASRDAAARDQRERLAWEVYEAIVEQERQAVDAVEAARAALDGIRQQRSAAKALLDRAMAARNRMDLGPGSGDAASHLPSSPRNAERLLRSMRIPGDAPSG